MSSTQNIIYPLPKGDTPSIRDLMDMIRLESEKALAIPLNKQFQIVDYSNSISTTPNRNGVLYSGNHDEQFEKYLQTYAKIAKSFPKEPVAPYLTLSTEEYNLMLDLAIEVIASSPESPKPNGRCAIALPQNYYMVFDKVPRPKGYASGMVLEFGKVDHDTNHVLIIRVIDSKQIESDVLAQRIVEAFTFREDDPDFPAIERIGLFFEKYAQFSYHKSLRGDTGEWYYDRVRNDSAKDLITMHLPKVRGLGLKSLYYMPVTSSSKFVNISNV